jgi:hypothetical protein
MAAGMAVTKEPGTDRFAERFHAAGFWVLAFVFRGLGGNGGRGRLCAWRSTGRPPRRDRVSGDPELGAAIAVSPGLGGRAAARNAVRHQTDRCPPAPDRARRRRHHRWLAGREPLLVPLVGELEVAVLTTPDARNCPAAQRHAVLAAPAVRPAAHRARGEVVRSPARPRESPRRGAR